MPSGLRDIRTQFAAGAVAGNVTVNGIKVGDTIRSVSVVGLTEGTPNTFSGIADLTAEFKVTADNTINNTGGTSTAGKLVVVVWEVEGGGRAFGRLGSGRTSY